MERNFSVLQYRRHCRDLREQSVMKVIVFALFASLAIGGVFGDDKTNAIDEINDKYKELFGFAHQITRQIGEEIKKTDQSTVDEVKEYGKNLKSKTLTEFSDEVKKTSRTAIVRGKPLSTFECLANVAMEGRNQILEIHDDFVDRVNNVARVRGSRLQMSLVTAGLILDSVTELKNQAVKNINAAESGIKALKEEALKRIETGKKQFTNLERSIQKPTLKEEYLAVRESTENKFKETRDALFRRVQRC